MLESFFNKVTGVPATLLKRACEIYEIFKNTYFEGHLQKAASVLTYAITSTTCINILYP